MMTHQLLTMMARRPVMISQAVMTKQLLTSKTPANQSDDRPVIEVPPLLEELHNHCGVSPY
jgi:hypothetical protein